MTKTLEVRSSNRTTGNWCEQRKHETIDEQRPAVEVALSCTEGPIVALKISAIEGMAEHEWLHGLEVGQKVTLALT